METIYFDVDGHRQTPGFIPIQLGPPKLNSYSPEELRSLRLHEMGWKIHNPPIAEIDGHTLDSLDSSDLSVGHKKDLKKRLLKLQKQLDRSYKRS